jgi:nicotinamidase-related amidase
MSDTITLDPATTALMLIDVQNDFCTPGGFYDRAGQDISALHAAVAPCLRLLGRARAAEMPVVFTRIVRHPDGPTEDRHRLRPKRWFSSGTRLVPGTWGAALVDGLEPAPGDLVLDKNGYSAFHGTNLEANLRERNIRTLLFAGVVTYACVLATAFAAFDRGFDVVVAADATGSWITELGPASHAIVDLLLGHAVPADDLRFGP